MMNISSSGLEREWLEFLGARGCRLPDRAQPYLPIYATRPDFAYSNSQTLIYVDGPVHQQQVRERNDVEIELRLRDAGYTVVRFTSDRSAWVRIVGQYAWVFGPCAGGTTE